MVNTEKNVSIKVQFINNPSSREELKFKSTITIKKIKDMVRKKFKIPGVSNFYLCYHGFLTLGRFSNKFDALASKLSDITEEETLEAYMKKSPNSPFNYGIRAKLLMSSDVFSIILFKA